jgi:glucose-6-phosphate 1-dehydrogenase
VRVTLAGSGDLDLGLVVKTPGPQLTLTTGTAHLDLGQVPAGEPLPAYAALLHDVMIGDRSLFTSREGLRHAWRTVAPLLTDRPAMQPYAQGSWGPQAASGLPITARAVE